MGIGTQINGFGHLGVDHHYYNGITGQEIATQPQAAARRHSADRDARRADRHDQALQEALSRSGRHVQQEPRSWPPRRRRGVKIGKGDVVLFHGRWMAAKMEQEKDLYRWHREPGIGEEGAQYLGGPGCDRHRVETVSRWRRCLRRQARRFIVHQTLLAKNGVHVLGDHQHQRAGEGRREGIPLRAGHSAHGEHVQMVIDPVAIR